MSLPRRLLAILVLSQPLVACLPPAKTGCHTSSDCAKGRVCVSGTCHDDHLDGGEDIAPATSTDLAPQRHDGGEPSAQLDLRAPDGLGDVAAENNPGDVAPACPGALDCAVPRPDGPLPDLEDSAGRGPEAPVEVPRGSNDLPGAFADGVDGPAANAQDVGNLFDGSLDVSADIGDASEERTDIPLDLTNVPDRALDFPVPHADLSDGPGDMPPALADAPDGTSDTDGNTADLPQADCGIDASPGLDGQATPCATSEDCVPPQVCNLNTEGTCGMPVYTQVDVAAENTCAVVSDGTVRCWGGNTWGQLGPEKDTVRPNPFPIPDQAHVVMVATGWSYTCTLRRSGQVDCWGNNVLGELGCAMPVDSSDGPRCTPYSPGSSVVQVVAGAQRPCARKRDGTVECWGRNDHYDLGNGTDLSGPTPTPVSGVSEATAIASGLWQGCAVTTSGSLSCWGPNDRGQLGNGTLDTISVPTTVLGMDGTGAKVLAASTAEDHSCALLAGGSVQCFGENLFGELGNGEIADFSTTPVPCAFSGPAVIVASGIWFTCAALNDGSVECLGKGDVGQLGGGVNTVSLTATKVALPSGTALKSMASKYHHTCGLDFMGRLWCWGHNGTGQLGNGSTGTSNVPVLVGSPAGV